MKCECCNKREPAGYCIVNGHGIYLEKLCRYCFTRNPEKKEQGNQTRTPINRKAKS